MPDGLTYPPHLLSHLPVLRPRPYPHTPIRALSAAQFSSIHLQYLITHAPDNVLFPFLHGLEGSNHAQNLFFANNTHKSGDTFKGIQVPNFRGLIWVVCDDDLDQHTTTPSAEDDDDDIDDDSFSDASSSYLADSAMDVDQDPDNDMDVHIHNSSDSSMHGPTDDSETRSHMHPITHRSNQPLLSVPAPIPIINTSTATSSDAHTRRDSTASSTCSISTSTDSYSMSASASLFASSVSSPATSISSSVPPDKLALLADAPSRPPPPFPSSSPPLSPSPASPPQPQPNYTHTLLTSTFYARDLLKASAEGQAEFLPPKVPSGISLRNFGIQVPIYATISDIVIYSPRGLTANAIALAEKFKIAVERKAMERLARLGKYPAFSSSITDGSAPDSEMGEEDNWLEANALLAYNVFVLSATAQEMHEVLPHLIMRHADHSSVYSTPTASTASPLPLAQNTVDFAQRERDEMRDLTKASEIISVYPSKQAEEQARAKAKEEGKETNSTASFWDPHIGQVFLGNSNDVPIAIEMLPSVTVHTSSDYVDVTAEVDRKVDSAPTSDMMKEKRAERQMSPALADSDPFNYSTNDPAQGFGYDICIECTDLAPFPSTAHLRAAEDHLQILDAAWAERCRKQRRQSGQDVNLGGGCDIPIRPPPNANAVIHLPFPSSPLPCNRVMNALVPVVTFLERVLQVPTPTPFILPPPPSASAPPRPSLNSGPRRWSSSVTSLLPAITIPTLTLSASYPTSTSSSPPPPPSRTQSLPSNNSNSSSSPSSSAPAPARNTRPLKVLIYSSDGYTESSVPALCLLMAVRGLSLPGAYLELQVVKKRSFFVYQGDLGILRRVESRFYVPGGNANGGGGPGGSGAAAAGDEQKEVAYGIRSQNPYKRPAANSVSFSQSPFSRSISHYQFPSQTQSHAPPNSHSRSQSQSESETDSSFPPPTAMIVPSQNHIVAKSRPRASTSPWLPSLFADHQAWFNDPRFDGSFPSRVLPFLYLGNLNHASNVYMLHALGITHVVSVGECALVPPPHINTTSIFPSSTPSDQPAGPHFIAGKGPGHQGSLWIEEREGRIKVLDIKGVCDDGIDTLEPQLEPICSWIERARAEGGQVLVHCRVGVSRSATVTIAYVMKHLGLPLVDAYLIVRSRRLSVLIQPNMRLLYNLCGWEVKLAKERAGDDVEKLRIELSRALSWPYLAKQVHVLNEKYLY